MSAQVKGRVTDASNDSPVENALIISGGVAGFSDANGNFFVEFSDSISIEAAGYQRIFIKADTLKSIVILLKALSYNLSEVSITAYHTPGKLRSASGAVSVIPIGPAQFSGYNIVSSLTASPGLYIQEATPGTMKLTLRGIGSRYPYGTKKIKMYFDEIPLYSAESETSFDDINPEYLSRIEILRGPASSIYGASLGGAIDLFPKRPEFDRSELKLLSSAGSFGYNKNTLSYAMGNLQNDLLVSVSRVKSDGYRENSNYLRNSFLANYNNHFGEKFTGTLLLSGSLIDAQIPSSIDSATFMTNPRKAAPIWLKTKGNKKPVRILAGFKLKYRPSDNWYMIGSLFSTYRKNEENRPFNFLNEDGLSYGGRFLTRYLKNSGKFTYIFTGGSNLFFEDYNNSISENPGGIGIKGNLLQKGSQNIYQTDIFSQLELKYSQFTLTGGINFNKSGFHFTDLFSSDTIDQSGYYNFNPVFSPRISLTWNPFTGLNTYLAINHGFTVPQLNETMTALGLINRDIKPEKAWSYETGLRYELFKKTTYVDLALYSMNVSDLIVPKRVEEDFYVGMNAGASLHRGIELAIQQWLWGKPDKEKISRFSAIMNLSYSANRFNFLDFVADDYNFSGNKLPGMPEHYFSGNIDFKTKAGIYAQIELISTGKIAINDFNSRFTSSWNVLNSTAGYTVKLKKGWIIDAVCRINNITDKLYSSMIVVNAPGSSGQARYYYPGMPRWISFSIGLGYSLDKK